MSERLAYLVCYDICEPKRLRLTYRAMRGFGRHMQYSVFQCELDDAEKVEMKTVLAKIINQNEDQVLIVPLGPPRGRYVQSMETIGTPLGQPPRTAVVI
jgi:CRISPR-associated protein Cas2